MSLRHILFDFFGTLVEYSASRTEQGYAGSHEILRRTGSPLDYGEFLALWEEVADGFEREAERSHNEYSMHDVVGAFLRRALPGDVKAETLDEFTACYLGEWNRGVRYSGTVRALLEELAERYTLSIITNTHDRALVPDHLRAMGVRPLFREVVTSVEFGRRKPDPAIFDHARALLGAKVDECLYVGDNYRADFEGGEGAGIRSLLIDPEGVEKIPAASRLADVASLRTWLEPR